MSWDDLRAALGRFGFTEREARLYLYLLRRGAAKVSDLTKEAAVDRVHAYRLLDGMRSRGLVQSTTERPRRYVALPLKVLFERSLFERRRALEEDVDLARRLEEHLPDLAAEPASGVPRFQVLTGAPAIYPFLRELVQRSTKSLDVMITARAFRDSRRYGISSILPRFVREGGQLRMLVETDPRIESVIRRARKGPGPLRGLQARSLPSQRARITVADGREALVFLVPEPDHAGVEEIAVWTDNPDFVRAEQAHFDSAWTSAAPLQAPK